MYLIIENTNRIVLEQTVQDYQKLGFKLQGGVAIAILPAGREWPPIYKVHYAQAIVREDKDHAESNT